VQTQGHHFVVHKFGGASVRNSEAVRNVGTILNNNLQGSAVVVVSAMGKTTNHLENVLGVLIQPKPNLMISLNLTKQYRENSV
jgi:aspartate kinase